MLFILSASVAVKAQQNLQFSQYAFNGLSVNPAYAGYKEVWYLNATYRHQWSDLPGAPRTGSISIDGTTTETGRVGLGLQFMYDQLGPQKASAVYANYSYRIPLDETGTRRLCFGLGAGVTQYNLDGTALKYNQENDPAIPIVKTNRVIPDVRFGVYYFTSKYYLGLSVMDLMSEVTDGSRYAWNGNDYSTIRKTRHFYLTGGAMWPLSDVISFKPSFMVKEDFKGPTNFDLNASFLIAERVWIGGSWRSGVKLWNKDHLQNDLDDADAFSFLAEFFANDNIRIGYAYDYMYNGLSSYQRGTHEISIGYSFNSRKARMRVLSPRYF